MRKFLVFQILPVFFLLTSYTTTSHGQSKFSQYYNKGIEYYKQGKYDQAGEQFEKALELKPNHVYAMYGLGNTYYCKGKYDEAVKIYTKAIEINPDYPKVHYSLSLAYSKLGMTRDAEKEKEIFRKLTQGEKVDRKIPIRTKSTSTENEKKEVLSKAKKDIVVETKRKTLPKKKATESKPKDTRLLEKILQKPEEKPAERKSIKTDESQTIFKGYTEETGKARPRVYVKKYKGPFTTTKTWAFIKNKWNRSGINKILICTCGYILATQMWLCVVAFFGLIIWEIRKKAE